MLSHRPAGHTEVLFSALDFIYSFFYDYYSSLALATLFPLQAEQQEVHESRPSLFRQYLMRLLYHPFASEALK